MNPIVEFVAADVNGLIMKETWRATGYMCPRCKNAGPVPVVWALISTPPVIVMGQETRIFMCVACQFTLVGLNGFRPEFDTSRRAQQIIQLGIEASETE